MPGNALMCLHRHSRLVSDCRAHILLLSSDGVKMTNTVNTSALSIGYIAGGPPNGSAVVLLHGWPDDALTWNGVAPALHTAGLRTYAPYLRGFGPTRFNDASIKRSGQLSALGADVIAFADALKLQRFAVIGHDWGARAAYIAAALWPERSRASLHSPSVGARMIRIKQSRCGKRRIIGITGTWHYRAGRRLWKESDASSRATSGTSGALTGNYQPRTSTPRPRRLRIRIGPK
jgi:pimeloyl-ACP methyl ester carboxylesterase